MIYFDTSYMLKCYLPERGHAEVTELWQQSDDVVCCELGKSEFAAALHRHVREGRITLEGLQGTLAAWRDDQAAGLWRWLPLNDALFDAVVDLFEHLPGDVFLRSGDAIHLACAREHGVTPIHTNDRHLTLAANHLGLATSDVVP